MQPYNSSYDGDARGYDELRSCWLNERRERFIAARLDRYELPEGALVVEAGSGTGWLLNRLGRRFPRLRFLGIEPLAGYVEYARRLAPENVAYRESALEAADGLPASAFLSNDVLHHVSSYGAALEAVARFASPGCRWLAIEPNCKNVYTFARQAAGYGERNFWPGRFRKAAAREGWRVSSRGHLFLVPPSMKQPPAWMQSLEQRFERAPFLAGGVYLEFVRREDA